MVLRRMARRCLGLMSLRSFFLGDLLLLQNRLILGVLSLLVVALGPLLLLSNHIILLLLLFHLVDVELVVVEVGDARHLVFVVGSLILLQRVHVRRHWHLLAPRHLIHWLLRLRRRNLLLSLLASLFNLLVVGIGQLLKILLLLLILGTTCNNL